jgi:hypothetical protein
LGGQILRGKGVSWAKNVAITKDAELYVNIASNVCVEDMDGEDDQPARSVEGEAKGQSPWGALDVPIHDEQVVLVGLLGRVESSAEATAHMERLQSTALGAGVRRPR